jgi:hypothetical protein
LVLPLSAKCAQWDEITEDAAYKSTSQCFRLQYTTNYSAEHWSEESAHPGKYIIDTQVCNGYEVCLKHLYKCCIFLPPSQALEKSDLEKHMSGPLPNKVQNITLSGRGFTQISHSLLRVSNIAFISSFIPHWFKVLEKKCYFI